MMTSEQKSMVRAWYADASEKISKAVDNDSGMSVERIRKISEEIEQYKQAIQDAEDALAEAERELDEELEARLQKMDEEGNGYV